MRYNFAALIMSLSFASCLFCSTIYSVKPFIVPGQEITLGQINDAGEIVGSMFPDNGQGVSAFILSPSGSLATLPLSGGEVQGYGINNLGDVTGFANQPGFIYYANGASKVFSAPGKVLTVGKGINDAGEVVGTAETLQGVEHGFIRAPNGKITVFDVPGGKNTTQLTGINDAGEIVGYYQDRTGFTHSFTMEANGTDFHSFDVCNYHPSEGLLGGTFAFAINDRDQVAGFCSSMSGDVGFISDPNGTSSTYGFDPVHGITNTIFFGINDEDVVTGNYVLNGHAAAFIATPVSEPTPEPSTKLLTVILVAAIPLVRRFRTA